MVMFDGKTTPEEVIRLVYQKIDEIGGLAKAFPHNKHIQLYSGPNYRFFPLDPHEPRTLIGPNITNELRAKEQAKEKTPNSTLINGSPIGKFLFEENKLYEWFNDQHTDTATGETDWDAADKAAKQVMNEVSALFKGFGLNSPVSFQRCINLTTALTLT